MKIPKLSVLVTGYEATPFFKKGGLGDVIGSLPIALWNIGVDARVVMPYYSQIRNAFHEKKIGEFSIKFGAEERHIKIYAGTFPRTIVPIYFLENQKYISLSHTKIEKIEQFAFFDVAVCYFTSWLTQEGVWKPDLIHCNDWHTALIPLILQQKLKSAIPTLLTIHNLLYQGKGSVRLLHLLDIPEENARELRGKEPATELNILGEGILHANAVSTVSPTYASEISHSNKRSKVYSFLHTREGLFKNHTKVIGVLNGIDQSSWNPNNPVEGFVEYQTNTVTEGKKENKAKLLAEFHLLDRPTFCFIGRMTTQKGLDVLSESIDKLVLLGANIILLGKGNYIVERKVFSFAKRYQLNVKVSMTYSESMARKLHAGSDFLLMPSHYEPCGLVQMAAMRYGTIPVVARTGGLIDTVHEGKTGFLFEPGSAGGLVAAVEKALAVYDKPDLLKAMRIRCMKQDFSWDKSAKEYKRLYEELLHEQSA